MAGPSLSPQKPGEIRISRIVRTRVDRIKPKESLTGVLREFGDLTPVPVIA